MSNQQIYLGDCLQIMKNLPDKSIDMICCDLPYGKTNCKWDTVIPFEPLWAEYNRVIKDNGCIALFGSEPFSSKLRLSNLSDYKYDIYWEKEKPTNFFQLKRRVGRVTENICIFYKKQCTYNPQMVRHEGKLVTNKPSKSKKFESIVSGASKTEIKAYTDTGYRYPTDILKINREKLGSTIHDTQKPVKLVEWLINTYTNPGDTVLDNCMGSGTCGVACKNLGRNFIGIELDPDIFEKAKERLAFNI